MNEITNFLDDAENWLKSHWGINESLAQKIAVLILWLEYLGVSWEVTSGFRDPKRQRDLQKAWDRGNRQGLKVRPATNSKHSHTTFLGKPNAHAIDIATSDEKLAGEIAKYLRINWGGDFKNYDPVHFYI